MLRLMIYPLLSATLNVNIPWFSGGSSLMVLGRTTRIAESISMILYPEITVELLVYVLLYGKMTSALVCDELE